MYTNIKDKRSLGALQALDNNTCYKNPKQRKRSLYLISKSLLISIICILFFVTSVQSGDAEKKGDKGKAHSVSNLDPETEYQQLPKNVQPVNYNLKLTPDLKTFVFEAKLAILLKVLKKSNYLELNSKNLNLTRIETEYQQLPKNVQPVNYNLKLTPDLKTFVFEAKLAILLKVLKKSNYLELNSKNLNFTRIGLLYEGKDTKIPLDSVQNDHIKETIKIKLPFELLSGKSATLKIEYIGEINDMMVGLYRSKYDDKAGAQKYMAVTQFGPTDARRAMPCWDEPSLKATFDVTLMIDKKLEALSNMDVKSKVNAGNLTEVTFEQTPIMSTYLLAFTVGEFEHIESYASGGSKNTKVRCRVYTPPGLVEHGRFGLDVAVKSLKYFSEAFDMPYPLKKLDIIAVPDFGSGAMENWGLITFRTEALLVHEKFSSTKAKQHTAVMVGHEVAHQWFGNLVTMKWWNDLWLNEGFATWAGNLVADHLFPEWEIWTQFLKDMTFSGLSLDSLRSSHPIEVSVRKAEEIFQIFDTISYNKGASLIKMLSVYMGPDKFNKGVKEYLNRYKYKNASTNELWETLSKFSDKNVSQLMSSWTKNMGYPILTVEESKNGQSITVTQNRYFTSGNTTDQENQIIWNVPLFISDSSDTKSVSKELMTARKTDVKISKKIVESKNGWYKLNTDAAAFVRVKYPLNAITQLSNAVSRGELSVKDRLSLLSDTSALSYSGHVKTSNFLTLLKSYSNETNLIVSEEIVNNIDTITKTWSTEDQSTIDQLDNLIRDMYAPVLAKLGWDPKPNEDGLTSRLRALATRKLAFAKDTNVITEAKARFDRFFKKKDQSALNPDNQMTVFAISVKFGGEEEYNICKENYLNQDLPVDIRMMSLRAMGFVQSTQLMKTHFDFILSDKVRNQDIISGIAMMSSEKTNREALWEWFKRSYGKFEEIYKGVPTEMIGLINVCAGEFSSLEKAQEIKKFFANKDTSVINKSLDQIIEEIKLRAEWIKRDRTDVKTWLDKSSESSIKAVIIKKNYCELQNNSESLESADNFINKAIKKEPYNHRFLDIPEVDSDS
ncbi:hypothetical protein BB561_001475 [Smittium simulii]|uniref:Aminopeptidase n=1 Tax=Smittium simulii TaxID=133385 RepID=A0A2T9YUG6_9FUNG|nr:hypothetical protein BB561_001475 [Smittium simulii]